MKMYKTVQYPARSEREVVGRKCDLCGKKGQGEMWPRQSHYDINDTRISVEISQREGCSYPEGGSATEYEIDLCPECFKEKLIPWLISQGAQIEAEEKDW